MDDRTSKSSHSSVEVTTKVSKQRMKVPSKESVLPTKLGANDGLPHSDDESISTMEGRFASSKRKVEAGQDEDEPSKKLKTRSEESTALVWFKMDLRIFDNPALHHACSYDHVFGLFIINPAEWASHDMAPLKADFILRNLACLKQSLAQLNIPLIVKSVEKATDAAPTVVEVAKAVNATAVFWNMEFEVDEAKRDKQTQTMLLSLGISVKTFQDQCIMNPGSLLTKDGRVYKVFTHFRKAWIRRLSENESYLRILPAPEPKRICSIFAAEYASQTSIPSSLPLFPLNAANLNIGCTQFPAGESEAHARLSSFLADRARKYHQDRDLLSKDGTSTLSPYLSSGIITIRQCIAAAVQMNGGKLEGGLEGITKWISELIWREFYRHILVEFPRVCKNKGFKPESEAIPWRYDEEAFHRWCEGNTGYPLVDAGMRQLNHLGWMHNRARMITAMFLCKDLMLDWRKGERYFMQNLIDGDLANNNGGWQWCASTGVDPQPYFRIMNPTLQSEKCDPTGEYIREWVPELRKLRGKAIHAPYKELPKEAFVKLGYPAPIVDHKSAREACLQAFKIALKVAK